MIGVPDFQPRAQLSATVHPWLRFVRVKLEQGFECRRWINAGQARHFAPRSANTATA
jgi:hypothetical protein